MADAKVLFLGLMIALAAAGCGVYTFNPRGKATIKSISVLRFDNETPEYGLADQLTDGVIDAFIADGTVNVVPEDAAEAVLQGTLNRYSRRPHTYDRNDQVQEYKVEMDFTITLTKVEDESTLWNERFSHFSTYDVQNETEEDAQKRVISLLVESIINRTTKSW